jgi:hypothetical protein
LPLFFTDVISKCDLLIPTLSVLLPGMVNNVSMFACVLLSDRSHWKMYDGYIFWLPEYENHQDARYGSEFASAFWHR